MNLDNYEAKRIKKFEYLIEVRNELIEEGWVESIE